MKTTIVSLAVVALALGSVTGCAYRDAKMWQDDTGKVLASKNEEIKACYDGVLKGAPSAGGKVTVKFEVETEAGKIQNVQIDKAGSTAPDELGACVKKSIEGLTVSPPDKRTGQATYVYEFAPKAS